MDKKLFEVMDKKTQDTITSLSKKLNTLLTQVQTKKIELDPDKDDEKNSKQRQHLDLLEQEIVNSIVLINNVTNSNVEENDLEQLVQHKQYLEDFISVIEEFMLTISSSYQNN